MKFGNTRLFPIKNAVELVRANAIRKQEEFMMPLTIAAMNENQVIKKVGGSSEVRTHLENLGFVPGSTVTVVSSMGGNLIVSVKDSRVALSRELAAKIMV